MKLENIAKEELEDCIFPFKFPLDSCHLGRLKILMDLQFNGSFNCDHSHTKVLHALEFCRTPKDVQDKIIQFLEKNGGYCDCEVMMNVDEEFKKIEF